MHKLLLGLVLSLPLLAQQIGPQNGTRIENTTVLQDPSGNCRTSDYQRKLTNLLVNPPREWVCVNINPQINLFGTWVQLNTGGTGGASVWGQINGTLSDQTDLEAALNAPISATQLPAFSGDATTTAGSSVLTFKTTVNDTPGTFGSTTQCVTITVNNKGQLTHVVQAACAGGGGSTAGLTSGSGVPTAIPCDPGVGNFMYQDTANTTVGTDIYTCIAHNTWAHMSYIGPSQGLKNCGVSFGDNCIDADSTVLEFLALPQNVTALKTFQAGISLLTPNTEPTCASGVRGNFWYLNNGASKDNVDVCVFNGTAFAWVHLY